MAAILMGMGEARRKLAELLDQTQSGDAIIITRHGQPQSVLMPIEWAKRYIEEQPDGLAGFFKSPSLPYGEPPVQPAEPGNPTVTAERQPAA